MNKILSKSAN